MTSADIIGNVPPVEEAVLPGDVTAGDVIGLPGSPGEVLVRAIRLGQGGFILTVVAVGEAGAGPERTVTLTAGTRLSRHGRVPTA